MLFFMFGPAVGSLARFGRRLALCGPRFCGKYYIKFVQEEDAISISERIEQRKSGEQANQSQSGGGEFGGAGSEFTDSTDRARLIITITVEDVKRRL